MPVQVSLNGVQLDSVMGNVCANTGPDSFGVLQVLTDAVQAPPPLYIDPYRSKTLRFVYQAVSVSAGGTQYNLAGSFAGLPARPSASFTISRPGEGQLAGNGRRGAPMARKCGIFFFSPGGQACGATQTNPQSAGTRSVRHNRVLQPGHLAADIYSGRSRHGLGR